VDNSDRKSPIVNASECKKLDNVAVRPSKFAIEERITVFNIHKRG